MSAWNEDLPFAEVAYDDTLLLQVRGEIDIANVAQLKGQLIRAVTGPWRTVALDLSEVAFLGVTGSHPIEEAATSCERSGRRLHIIRPQPQVRWLLERVGVAEAIVTDVQ
ncbi:MAG TPA: STAS domain-containing protein [Mycobacteriales bacterium]|nr:STAS domain-containing protein [Mycobacteriales bacterium]